LIVPLLSYPPPIPKKKKTKTAMPDANNPALAPPQPSQTRGRQRSASQDMGDPLATLACKGITKDNKADLKVLVVAMRTIIPPQGSSYSIKKTGAEQMTAICALLEEMQYHPTQQDDDAPVTKKQMDEALQRLSESIGMVAAKLPSDNTYVGVTRHGVATTDSPHKTTPLGIQEKQVTISLRKIDRNAKVLSLSLLELTSLCNSILTTYFARPEYGDIAMESPLRGTSRSQAGNITLTFKTKDNATHAKIHEGWIKNLDIQATILQRMYAVVVHNAPVGFHKEDGSAHDTIASLEEQNTENIIPHMLTHVAWLNGAAIRQTSRYGPLLLCFKSKEATNKIIDSRIVLDGALCQVSLYIPRPSKCFRCQNWGHCATECTREARCRKCAGAHNSMDHKCTHSGDCPAGTECKAEPSICPNCNGDHPSWVQSCPVAHQKGCNCW
jgi:hypothetical protein